MMSEKECQGVFYEVTNASIRLLRPQRVLLRLKQHGMGWALGEVLQRFLSSLRPHGIVQVQSQTANNSGTASDQFAASSKSNSALSGSKDVSLGLRPGDRVRIKTRDEVMQTLDGLGKTRGLKFMPEMWKHCGETSRVYKRLNTVIVEGSGEIRRLTNTVLLESLVCDGSEHYGCDRACFFWWREAWLEKIKA